MNNHSSNPVADGALPDYIGDHLVRSVTFALEAAPYTPLTLPPKHKV